MRVLEPSDTSNNDAAEVRKAIRAPAWLRYTLAVALLFNLTVLLGVQHHWHGDFPFQDEWGYVARLQHIPQSGFLHYLFDRSQTYFVPVLFFIWYGFYELTHLDIEAIRYTGALAATLTSLLLCTLLCRKATRFDWPVWPVLLYAPFLVCSLNHYAAYYQSIESVTHPLLIGLVLSACWATEGTFNARHAWRWTGLTLVLGLLAAGTYAAGLSLLPAIAAALWLTTRRFAMPSILFAVLGLVCIGLYVQAGRGLTHPNERPAGTLADLLLVLQIWIGLTGNAVFSPHAATLGPLSYVVGVVLLGLQAVGLFLVMRRPREQRRGFLIPVALSLYNNLVVIEILYTRFHFTEPGFIPRYSMLMLAGPISVLFYLVMLNGEIRRVHAPVLAVVTILLMATAAADGMIIIMLPHLTQTLATVRSNLVALQAEPNDFQSRQMLLTPAARKLVYPGRQFLEQEHLALYRKSSGKVAPLPSDGTPHQ